MHCESLMYHCKALWHCCHVMHRRGHGGGHVVLAVAIVFISFMIM